jgi:hypothetical protein
MPPVLQALTLTAQGFRALPSATQAVSDSVMRGRGGEGFLGVLGLLALPAMGPWAAEQLLAYPSRERRQTTRPSRRGWGAEAQP